jgi:deazaflavin-dependent oxidoreductase (nitroreductase family)
MLMSTAGNRSSYAAFNDQLIADMRAHGGKPTSGPFLGRNVLILTTVGARSGERRETPLAYSTDGDRYVVIGSKGGAPTHPAWYHNLRANPLVAVEVLGDRFEARALVALGDERDRLFRNQADQMPAFNDYQKRTSRQLPVIVLERAG